MIITFTANPGIDKTATVDKLIPGGLNRLGRITKDMAGKGINVARMVNALGCPCVATGLLGKNGGSALTQSLDAAGISHNFVPVDGELRTNLKVLDATGTLTELNESGCEVSDADWHLAEQLLASYAVPGTVFVLSGSLPPASPANTYQKLCVKLAAMGASVILDADGEPFRLALQAQPHIVKPNRYELAEYFGVPETSNLAELYQLCRKLVDTGIGLVALSLGAEGALFVSASECWHAPGLEVDASSPVGAGDSMVAALACGTMQRLSLPETAVLAIAASAAAVTTQGTKPPVPELVERLKKQVVLQSFSSL